MTAGHKLLMAGALAGALLASDGARAQGGAGPAETWICSDANASEPQRPPLQFSVENKVMVEQPLGAPRYQVLDNTKYGLVGVDYTADLDPMLGFVSLYVATVMIDRESGHFTSTLATSGKPPQHRTGHCRRVEAQVTAGSSVAERK